MRTLGLVLTMLFISFFTNAQEKTNDSYTITVIIDNVLSDNGTVIVGLHTAKTFMKSDAIQNLESKIKDGKVTLVFKNVAAGEFAILAMHDENDNKQMDREVNGMPKESYGMSGSSTPYGPPTFNDAKFNVIDKNLTFNIRF